MMSTTSFPSLSPPSRRVTPWPHSFPGHSFPFSGFMPPGEHGGAVSSMETAAHSVPLTSVPSTVGVTPWASPSELPAHGTPYAADDQWPPPPFSQHAGSEVYAQVLAMGPFPNPYGGPQASSSAAVQSQPHLTPDYMTVPASDAQGLVPMDGSALPHMYSSLSRVEQQQPLATPYDYTKTDSRDDFANANANANTRPILSGSSDETSDNGWTVMLNLDGTRVFVQALMAIGKSNLSALPKEWKVELADGLEVNILAIQLWMRKNKTPMVQLGSVDGTDNRDFKQLVKTIRVHSYAIVRWKNKDRLLLAPLGEVLLCATFPEEGTPKRPTPQPPRKVRTINRVKKSPSQKKTSPQKKKEQKSRQRSRPSRCPPTKAKSSNGPCDGPHPGTAAQNTMTLRQPLAHWQLEQPQMSCYPQDAMESTGIQGKINPPSQWHHYQMDGLARRQTISPPSFQVEQQHDAYSQAPRGELDAHGEHDQWMGTGAAGYMVDPPNLELGAMEFSEMDKYVNLDYYEVY